MRLLHTSRCLLRRRAHPLTIRYCPTGHPVFDQHLENILGNLNDPHVPDNAPTRLEGEYIWNSVLLRTYLEKIETEFPVLKQTLDVNNKGIQKDYLCFEYFDLCAPPSSIYDPPVDKQKWSNVRMIVDPTKIKEAEDLNDDQIHLLKLLANEHEELHWKTKTRGFNALSQMIDISCNRYAYRAQNKRWLAETLTRMLSHVRSATDFYLDLPLNVKHQTKQLKMQKLVNVLKSTYPKEWLSPPSAFSSKPQSPE